MDPEAGPIGADNAGVDNQGSGSYSGGEGQAQGLNPAWNDLLQVVPQDLHQQITPLLQKWDSGVNERFQKVHSEYEPWKDIRNGSDPETVKFGLNVLNQLQNDPGMVYSALRQYMVDNNIALPDQQDQQQALNPGQGQQEPTDNPYEQQLHQLQEQHRLTVEYLQAQQQEAQNRQADEQVNKEFDAAVAKYGLSKQDEHFISGLVLSNPGLSIDQAAKQVSDHYASLAQNFRPKPLIMGSGGGLPGGVQPQNMDSKQTKNLVVEMLKAANQVQNQ